MPLQEPRTVREARSGRVHKVGESEEESGKGGDGGMADTPFTSRSTTRASKPLELIHSDLSGKAAVPSLGGSFYCLSLIDDCTRFTWIYFLKRKSDAIAAIIDFIIRHCLIASDSVLIMVVNISMMS